MPSRRLSPAARRRALTAAPPRAQATNPPSEPTAPSRPAAPPTDDLRKRASMSRALHHFKSNVIAYLALFVALGGTSYAAATLPAGSVGTRQLRNHSVSPIKLQKGSIARVCAGLGPDRRGRSCHRVAGHVPMIVDWASTGLFPGGSLAGVDPIPSACFALATTTPASLTRGVCERRRHQRRQQERPLRRGAGLLSAPQTAVNVAVICPQP